MRQVYETEEILCTSIPQILGALKDGLNLLAAHAPVTVTIRTESSATLDALVDAGNGAYFRVYAYTYDRILRLYLYTGYMVDGTFTSIGSVHAYNLRTGTDIPYFCDLAIVNGGDFWDFGFNTAASENAELRMRSFSIKSSIEEREYRAVLVYSGKNSDTSSMLSSVVKEDGRVTFVGRYDTAVSAYNVLPGTVLLSPYLLRFSSHCLLGVPTIGDEIIYRASNNYRPCLEFVLNGTRYFSLGGMVIRSPQE